MVKNAAHYRCVCKHNINVVFIINLNAFVVEHALSYGEFLLRQIQ